MEKSAQSLVEAQRTFFNSGATRPIAFRRAMLKKLKSAILSREKDILDAVHRDLGKSDFEAFTTEIVLVLREIDTMLKNLGKWTKPRRRSAGLFNFPGKTRVYHDPHGVCLVMSPWNYPFQLTIMPLVGAIAGGNTVIVKPSAYSPATQDCIADMITETFDPSYITVVTGGRDANQNLLEQKFDYIFFTGGIQVGSLVMTQAAKRLTPVTLELGGKSPCIIAPDADIDRAAKRAAWGKCINAGQTCVAPDHFLVHRSVRDVFVEKMRSYIEKFYGIEPHTNPEFPNIINKKHFERLSALITSAQKDGATLVSGGRTVPETLKIEPSIFTGVTRENPLMQEELFGPIIPVLEWESEDDLVAALLAEPRPLALYVFTRNRSFSGRLMRLIPFGGGCINDTVMHLASHSLPFGGTGTSGMGAYHGKASFNTFTREKSVVEKGFLVDVPLRYAPFAGKYRLFRRFL